MKLNAVDCIELERRRKVVLDGLGLAHHVYQGGKAAPLEYAKALVVLSYQFFDIHAVEEGMQVLRNVPAAYFREVLPRQMEEDVLFARLCDRIACEVVEAGLVVPGYTSPNGFFQRPGVGIS
jgi:hypothetical protein